MVKFLYMGNSIKQIYAALELGEDNIKLIVAEYFNTRFNVLRIDQTHTEAINDFKVVDKDKLTSDITNLINNSSNKLGAVIESVILVLPAYNFKRFPLKSSVIPELGYVTKKDIARAISNSLKTKVDNDVIVANPMVIKYSINGIPSRVMPEKQSCDEVVVDIDLLCCDKQMGIDYVTCVEAAGVKVLDITLNTYAIAREAALFEESLKQNIICLSIERSCTYLTLLNKGKLVSTEVLFDGINNIVDEIKYKYAIADEDIIKLIKYDVNYNDDHLNDVVYAYNEDDKTKCITKYEINEAARMPIDELVDKLITMCKPIIETGANIFITGEGQQVSSLVEKIKDESNCEVNSYYPDTIGVRDPNLTALYGSLFVYRDKVVMNESSVACIDLLQYDSLIDQKQLDTDGQTITTKIKNLFKQYIERQDEE